MEELGRPDMTDVEHERAQAVDAYIRSLMAEYRVDQLSDVQVEAVRNEMFALYLDGGLKLPSDPTTRTLGQEYQAAERSLRDAAGQLLMAAFIVRFTR